MGLTVKEEGNMESTVSHEETTDSKDRRETNISRFSKHVQSKTTDQTCSTDDTEDSKIKLEQLVTEEFHIETEVFPEADEYEITNATVMVSNEASLQQHERLPINQKSFNCNIRNYRCTQKSNLERHIRRHFGEKPFQCNQCAYKCSLKGSLVIHMRIHSGEKRFECNECEFKCSIKSGLARHMRTHSCEKPFKCNICNYQCAQKSNLRKHIHSHI